MGPADARRETTPRPDVCRRSDSDREGRKPHGSWGFRGV